LSDPSEPEAREARHTVERQVQHLSRLIEDMIAVFGLSDGKVALCLERRPLRVLGVEGNRGAARTLQILLEKYGFAVEVAHTGRAGVELARTFRPHVVLCDLGLPEMDGFDVARTLRRDPSTGAARLIAVSGFGQEEDRRRAYEAGFNLHLTKPVE